MEIIAHGIWATLAASAANNKHKRLRVAWFAFWAAFPDLFSFAPGVAVAIWLRVFRSVPSGESEIYHSPIRSGLLPFDLYDLSHSLVVFALVFALVWLALRRPVWELLGWALHIVMDIPTHSAHFPTPFLWPLSPYRFSGISWRQGWFLALNYAVLAAVYLLFRMRRRMRRAAEAPPTEKTTA